MEIQRDVVIEPYTTFKMGGKVAFFADLAAKEEVAEFVRFAKEQKLPFICIGGGSNIIFPDENVLYACIGHIQIKGFEMSDEVVLKIGAGEDWDAVVERAVSRGLSGIEALSAIPGTAGATPVQNVGAYGQEIAHTLLSVEAFDRKEEKVIELSNDECKFAYRDSIFKHAGKDRYIILSITLRLSKNPPVMPAYPGVKAYFDNKNIQNPTLQQIRDAIIEIRSLKLPDPALIASCGSFFKNPLVSKTAADSIAAKYPDAIIFEISEGQSKIGAGWMIEKVGLKGAEVGNLLVYPHNALVLVNKGGASKKELLALVARIQEEVARVFGVMLEPEPVFVM